VQLPAAAKGSFPQINLAISLKAFSRFPIFSFKPKSRVFSPPTRPPEFGCFSTPAVIFYSSKRVNLFSPVCSGVGRFPFDIGWHDPAR